VCFRKEKLMKKMMGLAGVLSLAVILPGCGTDEREQYISAALDQIKSASDNMSAIKDSVVNWEKAKGNEKNKHLKNALESVTALTKNAQNFQSIKGRADKLEPPTPEARKELVDKYRDRFASAIENANKERVALNEAIARAEKKDKTSLAELKISLQKAQGDFENLVKQR
jgi:hypothetical protein